MTIVQVAPLVRRTLIVIVALLVAAALLVYAVSPWREAGFVYSSSVPANILPEIVWIRGAWVFAIALAANLVLLLLTSESGRELLAGRWRIATLGIALLVGGLLAYMLWLGLLLYLLLQAIVD